MSLSRYRDVIGGTLFFLFAATYFVMAFDIKQFNDGFLSSDFMPKVYGGVLMLLSVLQLLFAALALKKGRASTQENAGELSFGQSIFVVVVTFALLLGYVLLLKPVGFVIMSCIFIFFMTMMLYPADQRTWKRLLIIAGIGVLFSLVVYLLFTRGFALSLPAGILNL